MDNPEYWYRFKILIGGIEYLSTFLFHFPLASPTMLSSLRTLYGRSCHNTQAPGPSPHVGIQSSHSMALRSSL